MNEKLLMQLDNLISTRRYPNRSRAIQEAVRRQLARSKRGRLARQAAKLDRAFEQKPAEEGLGDLLECGLDPQEY